MTANTEPSRVTAGDTISWLKSLPAYPATDGWVLTYTLINQTAKQSFAAVAQGSDHLVSVSAEASAAWAPGLYTWVATVANGLERQTVGQGSFTVVADFTTLDTFDIRSSARKALDAVNLALESFGNKAYMQSYSINGRSMSFQSPGDFMAFRTHLIAELAGEEAAGNLAAGLSPRNQIRVRFGRR